MKAAAVFAMGLAWGQTLPTGRVVEKVACARDPQQTYALYLPSNYTPGKQWPILYCLDPGARGRLPVERFAKAAESEGFIVVGSNNSRNGPIEPVKEAIAAMLEDVHARFAVNDSKAYVAGFSGGARVALGWARGGGIAGVVACGAGFGEATPKELKYRLFLTAGVDDFNYGETRKNSLDLARNGVVHRWAVSQGGHEWLSEELALQALLFFGGKIAGQAAAPSKEEDKLEARYLELAQQAASGDAGLVKRLRKDEKLETDCAERRLARRVLAGTFVGAIEEARDRMSRKEYAEAARAWERAVLIRPESSGAWRGLGEAYAAMGNKKKAEEASARSKVLEAK